MKQLSGGIALVLAAVTLAACTSTGSTTVAGPSSSPAAPTSPVVERVAAHGVEAPIQDIPWSRVGPGWTLATWNAAKPTKSGGDAAPGEPTPYNSPDTLFLVSPEGGRYAVTTFTPPADGLNPVLADWSGDGNRALFKASGPGSSTDIIEVDLHTGKQTSFNVDYFHVTPRYTRPEGKAVLLAKSSDVDSPPSLVRVDLAGHLQLTYPIAQFGAKFGPDVLSTPDGTRLVLGDESGGLAVMGNDGKGVKLLPVAGQEYCSPVRWWDGDALIAVAECRDHEFRQMLWQVPVDGSTPTPLTKPNDGQQGEVLGANNAWQLPEGTFVQALGGCGYVFLAKVDSSGMPIKVSVPKVDEHSSAVVIGTYRGDLELHATLSCGTGQSLLSYDPGTDTSTVLLGGELNGGGVVEALPYPGDE